MLDYVLSFKKEDGKDSRAHPLQVVVETLGAEDPTLRKIHAQQLGNWFQAYAGSRSMPFLYKEAAVDSWYRIKLWSFLNQVCMVCMYVVCTVVVCSVYLDSGSRPWHGRWDSEAAHHLPEAGAPTDPFDSTSKNSDWTVVFFQDRRLYSYFFFLAATCGT